MNRERWQDFNQAWEAHREAGAKLADRWHRGADALSQMMINTGFVLNAGGIVAVPALHQFLNGPGTALPWERFAAICFFVGILAAAASGIAAIWNYRMIGEQIQAAHDVSLKELEEKWSTEGEFTPSEELKQLKAKPLIGSKIIPCTYVLGWVFGVLSYVAFLSGGMTIAWCAGSASKPAPIELPSAVHGKSQNSQGPASAQKQ